MSEKKGSDLPNPLEGLRPTQRRKCERCGRVRQVKNLTVVYYVGYRAFGYKALGDVSGKPPEEMEPLISCKEHDPWDSIR